MEISDKFWPRFETPFPCQGKLCIGKQQPSRSSGGVGANGPDARERRRIAGTSRTQQIFRALALLLEIGGIIGRVRRCGHGRPLQQAPVSASWAEERSVWLPQEECDRWAPPFPRTGGVL